MANWIKPNVSLKWTVVGFLFVSLMWTAVASAMVSGPCSNCHTMHNSQNAQAVSGTGPNPELLNNDCVGCHSSSASSTFYDLGGTKVPVVLFTGSAPTEYLAGGNFYWVKEGLGGDDSKGHNVFLGEPDDKLTEGAPGKVFSCDGATACHTSLSNRNTTDHFPELLGKYGCEGCHMKPRHHANDHPNGVSGVVSGKSQGWYRFLSAHNTELGVVGYESGTWEAALHDGANHAGATNHNEYLGYIDVTGETFGGKDRAWGFENYGGLGKTTTALCTGCHGMFHTEQKDANAMWVRHPSDAVIPDSGEYSDVKLTGYDPLSPVARPVIPAAPSSAVTAGTDMVMCLSCHRPHGSPYPDMLRWDYAAQASGGGEDGTGCFYCHTSKDD